MSKMNDRALPNTELHNFLGVGWSFPPSFTTAGYELDTVNDAEDIRQSLFILLSTAPGENLMHPDYGCPLHRFVFDPMTGAFQSIIRDLVQTAILYHEPRIRTQDVQVIASSDEEGRLDIIIDYIIVNTNTRTNMVYPFYLDK